MKLSILGGGGVRMPAFVRAVLAGRPGAFDQICLFEPDELRRATTGRLAAEIALVLGQPGVVTVTRDPAEAFTGADYVFSAVLAGARWRCARFRSCLPTATCSAGARRALS